MKNLFIQRKLYLVVLSVLYIAACSSQPDAEIPEEISALENVTIISPDATPLNSTEPVRDAVFGDTEEIIIGRIGPFTTDNDGNVYLPDVSQQVIHVYSPDGTHIDKIGGEGDGPGEFRRISSIDIDDDFIHIFDSNRMIISRFDLNTFEHVEDMKFSFDTDYSGGYFYSPYRMNVMEEGNYLVHFGMGYSMSEVEPDFEPKHMGLILDTESNSFQPDSAYVYRASEALVQRDNSGMRVMSVPYGRTAHVRYNSGKIMTGWSEELLFKWYDVNGKYLHAIYVPYNNSELTDNDIRDQYEDREEPWKGMVKNDDHPETWPSFKRALPDDEGRVWVGLITDDRESYTWKAFSQDGEIYASFTWPRHIEINRVQNGAIYTMETDPETDLRQVGKYRLP